MSLNENGFSNFFIKPLHKCCQQHFSGNRRESWNVGRKLAAALCLLIATCVNDGNRLETREPAYFVADMLQTEPDDASRQTSLPVDVAKKRRALVSNMCDKNLLLVKTIKKFPCLYNHQLTEYSRKDVTDKAWNEVANETKQTVSECKEKWKNLRYSFVRSLKPHPDGTQKKKYYLNDEMEFILPYVRILTSKTTGSLAQFLEYDGSSSDDEDNIDNNQDVASPLQAPYSEVNEIHLAEPQVKKTKLDAVPSKIHHQNPYVQERYDEDLRKMFLLSLLPEVAELTEPQMRNFRRKVLELLDEVSERRTTLHICEAKPVNQNDTIKYEPSQ